MKKGSMYIMHMARITQILSEDVIGCLISMHINCFLKLPFQNFMHVHTAELFCSMVLLLFLYILVKA